MKDLLLPYVILQSGNHFNLWTFNLESLWILSRVSLRDAVMLRLMNWFETRWNYPYALGAIDGEHVMIRKPSNAGSYYYNYKHTHSIILLAIAGPEYEFSYADAGSNGRVNDSGIWNKSSLLQAIQNGSGKLPKHDALPVNSVIAPYAFVGDDAFAVKRFMMKPYPQQNLTADKRYKIRKHIKKFQFQFERANVRDQRKFMKVGWNTPPN